MDDRTDDRPHAPASYVDGACALLGTYGPATPGLGVTPARVLERTRRSRSTLYRHFESAPRLNDELALHLVLAADGWQRRLLRQPPDAPFVESLTTALDGRDIGVWARCSVLCLPADSPARSGIVSWERQWLAQLEQWLDAHLAAHRLRYWGIDGRSAAVSLAALIEGLVLLDRLWTRPGDSGWHTGRDGNLPTKAARLLQSFTEDAPDAAAATPPDGNLPGPASGGAARTVLDELGVLIDQDPPGDPTFITPARLVAEHRLANRFQVTKRRIYDIWPTASDLNADIAAAIGRRFVLEAEACIDAILINGVDPTAAGPQAAVTTRAVAGFTMASASPANGDWFQITTALHDPVVLDAHIAVTVDATDTMRRLYLAQLWVHGAKLRPEVTFDEYMGVMRAAMVGTQRLITCQPELATESAIHRGEAQPLAGLAGNLIARSLVTRA